MRAEDVKIGAWVRGVGACSGVVGRVSRREGRGFAIDMVGSEEGYMGLFYAWEPWTPRVGDWVRFVDDRSGRKCTPWCVGALSDDLGASWCHGWDADGGRFGAQFGHCEPCAPPEAKPASAFIDELTAETRKACAEVSKALGPVKPIAPRDHNATCAKCGGKAYQGIGAVRCVEPVCDDPRERMPESVRQVLSLSSVTRQDELIWEAGGRGVNAWHPTKEGAILAWREAVNRG